ncbi:hypothetical protein [Dethiothermospora halolimnae]|uniref:hypothetical protein n=1 Tax=Dethiothermospora halolimnae TaxID=3114390 RepID=UPI003CCB9957
MKIRYEISIYTERKYVLLCTIIYVYDRNIIDYHLKLNYKIENAPIAPKITMIKN